jgi:hypothetical protein
MASSYYSSLYRRNVYLNASLNTDGTVAYTEIDEMLPGCAQASADNPCHSIDNRPQYTPGLDYLSYRDGACGGITTIAQYLNNQSETGICSQTEPQTNTVCASASNSGSTGGTSSSVSIATASLPNGKIGQAYNVTMRATGGSGNYLWGISQPLQAGLNWSSSGIIYGTPTESGTLTFTISAFDTSTKQVVFKTFSLTVGSTT